MAKKEKIVSWETRTSTQKEAGEEKEIKKSEVIQKPYERSDDEEAKTFISERIDIDVLVNKLESQVFTVKTEELYDDSETLESARQLLWAIARLVYELRERVLDYDSIISDDVSGRLPSLILRKLINRKREEQEKDPIPIYFVAGGKTFEPLEEIQRSSVRDFIEEKKDELGDKTLVSTEYIKKGHGIRWLLKIVKEAGLQYDVSTVGVFPEFEFQDDGEDVLSGRMIYGAKGSEGAFLYKKLATGVMKDELEWFSGRPTPHPRRKYINQIDADLGKTTKGMKTEIKAARKDINLIVKEMYKLLES